ncbi:T9SS type A sorting domain-containing protein [Chryseobacterium koreense]
MIQLSTLKKVTVYFSILASSSLVAQQQIIYQQNFDGNNGVFTNTIVSQTTPVNGWLTSSTAAQYGGVYRHLWNFSDVVSGGNANVLPISGRSLGMGFYNGNSPNVANQHFRTWDGTPPTDQTFFTTRWAHIGISTVGYENITVEFKWRCTGEVFNGTVYDYGTVNTSIDGGATWAMDQSAGQAGTTSQSGTFSGGLYFGNAGVQTATLTLPASRSNQANFRLAFRMVVDEGYGTGGGFIIDDIIVRGTALSMATSEQDKNSIKVYQDHSEFVVSSNSTDITSVEVYDMSGRMVSTRNSKSKEVRIAADSLAKGAYILRIYTRNGVEVRRILK